MLKDTKPDSRNGLKRLESDRMKRQNEMKERVLKSTRKAGAELLEDNFRSEYGEKTFFSIMGDE